jgi:hypothetical protein
MNCFALTGCGIGNGQFSAVSKRCSRQPFHLVIYTDMGPYNDATTFDAKFQSSPMSSHQHFRNLFGPGYLPERIDSWRVSYLLSEEFDQ